MVIHQHRILYDYPAEMLSNQFWKILSQMYSINI